MHRANGTSAIPQVGVTGVILAFQALCCDPSCVSNPCVPICVYTILCVVILVLTHIVLVLEVGIVVGGVSYHLVDWGASKYEVLQRAMAFVFFATMGPCHLPSPSNAVHCMYHQSQVVTMYLY
jgi:hypothetical protein